MATENDLSFDNESVSPDESASNKSFVKKVTSRVSGFLPSSLSKWFAGTETTVVRPRDETDDDDETLRIQPPTKKAKTNEPTTSSATTSLYMNNHHNARHLFVAPRAEIDRTKNNNNNNNANCIKFPEPIAGPSGYSTVKKKTSTATTKAALNMNTTKTTSGELRNCDYNSDTGESTSGYSSVRVGGKEMVADSSEYVKKKSVVSPEKYKTLFDTPSKSDRSLFNDRTSSSPHMNTSLSTRQPSFNSTAFAGTANFVDRTLSSKRILDSPFYSGRTTYGGASAYGRRMADRSHDSSSAIVRNSIQIKPVNEKKSESTSLSKTARRILDTLEQYTAPAADAKKIPNPPRNSGRHTHMNHPYAIRETKVPSNRELQVPTVPDLLKMKLKEKMQNTTVSVRRIANSSKCSLNTEEYKIATLDEDTNNTSKHMNKMKKKISSVREPKPELNEMVKEVKLPDVQLPITTLPVFNFAIPAPPSASSSNIFKPVETISSTTKTVKTTKKITEKSIEIKKTEEVVKETLKKDNNRTEQNTSKSDKKECIKQTEYIFSDPRVLSENDGKCKVCLVRNKNGETKCNSCTTPFTTTINGTMEHAQKYTYTFADPVPIEDNNKKNTSKSIIKSDLSQFKMSADKWECGTCLVRNNNNDSKCIACATPKVTNGSIPVTKTLPKITFGQFQPPSDTWECSVCMIRNKNDRKTCEACTSPKPAPKQENGIQGFHDSKPVEKFKLPTEPAKYPGLNKTLFKSDLLDKFKPASDTWECSVCMVRNKNAVTSCVACTTPKKGNGFGDQFKKKDDQWECSSCMVRNSGEKLKCICCDAPKPGSNSSMNIPKETKPAVSFNFGIVSNEAVGQMFNFGVKPIENSPKNLAKPPPSIFGEQSETKTEPPKFVFGVNPTETKKEIVESSSKVEKTEEKKVTLPEVNKPIVTLQETTKSAPIIKPTLNGDMNKTPLLFGNVSKPAETKPTFSFGTTPKPTEMTETKPILPVPVSQSFVFGGTTSTASTSIFSTTTTIPSIMSTPPTSTIANPTTSLTPFVLGNSAEKSTFRIQSTDKPSFLTVDLAGKPTFGTPQPTEKPTFGASSTEKLTFGVPQVTEKPSVFGVQPAEKPTFGTPSTEKLTFGVQPTEKLSLFGNASTKTTPGPKFGSSTTTPQSGIGGFNFGATPVNQTTPAQNGTFSFGKPATNTPTTTFNFGSQQKPAQGVFSFGSTPSTSTTPSTSGGFNFSANTEFQPNFNFTAGAPPSAFNSPSTGGNSVQERRVIRRALRRTQR